MSFLLTTHIVVRNRFLALLNMFSKTYVNSLTCEEYEYSSNAILPHKSTLIHKSAEGTCD